MSNSSIWPIVRILSRATISGQTRPGSDGNEWLLRFTGTILSDCLVSYPGNSLEESYPSAAVKSVYSTNWAALSRVLLVELRVFLLSEWLPYQEIKRPVFSTLYTLTLHISPLWLCRSVNLSLFIYIYIYIDIYRRRIHLFLNVTCSVLFLYSINGSN